MHACFRMYQPVYKHCCCCCVALVVSDSVRPHRRQPTRLPRPRDSPGKNTRVGCHFLLQCRKVKRESEVSQSCPTLATPWTAAYQAPPSMGFSRQKYWSGVPVPSPIQSLDGSKCATLRGDSSVYTGKAQSTGQTITVWQLAFKA